MDLEEFYDSLDEDSNYGSFESLEKHPTPIKFEKSKCASKIPVKTKVPSTKNTNLFSFSQDDDVVPFYDQCLSKSEVELKKTYSKNAPLKHSMRKKKLHGPIHNGALKSNSYLDMFYAKLGVEKIDLKSTRATCRDLTPVSCGDFEVASFTNSSRSESLHSCNEINEELSLSLTSLDSKFFSVSQQDFKIECNNGKPKKYKTPTTIHFPVLGSLGPDIPKDKLDLLKKRQDYGRKATQKNKIKMMEKKLLQNLQQEIKESKKIV